MNSKTINGIVLVIENDGYLDTLDTMGGSSAAVIKGWSGLVHEMNDHNHSCEIV